MHVSRISKYADFICVHYWNDIFVLIKYSLFISLKCSHINSSCISESVHDEHNFHLRNLLFLEYSSFAIFDYSSSCNTIFFLNINKISLDNLSHLFSAAKYLFILLNLLDTFVIFLLKIKNFKTNQLIQTHFQYGACLSFRKIKTCSLLL